MWFRTDCKEITEELNSEDGVADPGVQHTLEESGLDKNKATIFDGT